MTYTTERRQEIGQAQGIVYRQRALDVYYSNPNYCKKCGKIIEVPEGKKPGDIRPKKFCNHSCAAQFNNTGVDRWENERGFKQRMRKTIDGSTKICVCEECGVDIIVEPKRRPNGQKGYYYYDRRYCDDCVGDIRIKNYKKRLQEKAIQNGESNTVSAQPHTLYDLIARGLTKGDLRELTRKHGYYGWKALLTKHARKTYKDSGQPFVCQWCNFDFHVHICHRKDVKEFNDSELIKNINDINNLVALCPNHHIMFDKKAITI
jgi:hypothetical protein